MAHDGVVRIEFSVACRHDAGDLANLARRRMPEMTALHPDEGWHTYYRFGPGAHPADNYLLIARQESEGPLLGFIWVDAAMRGDAGIVEPWWCINAVAIELELSGRGLGRHLVTIVKERAETVGISALYGVCYPNSADFWRKQGFTVGELGQGLETDKPVTLADGTYSEFTMHGESENHIFTLAVGDRDDGHARLTLEH